MSEEEQALVDTYRMFQMFKDPEYSNMLLSASLRDLVVFTWFDREQGDGTQQKICDNIFHAHNWLKQQENS